MLTRALSRRARHCQGNFKAPYLRSQCKRTATFQQGPPKTYFQDAPQSAPKPPRRLLRSFLLGSTCFGIGALTAVWLVAEGLSDELDALAKQEQEELESTGLPPPDVHELISAGAREIAARRCEPHTVESATLALQSRSAFVVCPTVVAHVCQQPSNLPCEDAWDSSSSVQYGDPKKDWSSFSIFDGHAGPRTAEVLKDELALSLFDELSRHGCLDRPYVPNDQQIVRVIKRHFLDLDKSILDNASQAISGSGPSADVISLAAAAFSGSCALVSLFDPVKSVLRVANVGDSRAVLGRWDPASQQYLAKPMSVDQTGFNETEVDRIVADHPDEKVVDPKTGRVHGIAVSRAFGDARWKWSEALNKLAFNNFWGPRPRPSGLIKTPPYLSAEPEIMETKVQTAPGRADFLILASDGLWDLMSSQDAVTCVQMWLDKNKPTGFLDQPFEITPTETGPVNLSSVSPVTRNEADVYFDEAEQQLRWKTSPKHFVNEDAHCGVHLIKNALGGTRRNVFTGVMTVTPPLSRNVRDDITVMILFFGVDASKAFDPSAQQPI